MATISLTLRKVQHSTNEGVVYLRFTSQRQSSYVSLKVRLNKADFTPHEFPYIKKNAPHSARLNALLRSKLNKAQDILFDHQMKGETLSFQSFKSQFLPKKDMAFKEYALDYFIKRVNSRNEEKLITPSTYHTYQCSIKCFTKFANDPFIGAIDQKMVERFKDMLLESKSHSTAYTYLKAVHMAYQAAIADKYPNKAAFAQVSLITHKRELQKSKTPLTMDELKRLYQDYMDFKNDRRIGDYPVHYFPVLQKFLFSCLTGLRYSDVNGLKYSHLKKIEIDDGGNQWFVEKVIQKTQKLKTIPILQQALDLLDWKEDSTADTFVFEEKTIHRTNTVLKNIDKIVGINKAMTTHTGRHTFASLSITLGMRREVIQEILGHSSERMTERYAKISNQLMKNDLENRWVDL